MTLPPLPTVLRKREADWITKHFRKWLEESYKKTAVFEVKYAKGDSLPFSSVLPHQIASLQAVRHGTFVYKVPDMGERTPFDLYCMTEMPAYVVIHYKNLTTIINIDTFVQESKMSKRRSLTSNRAIEIAWKVIHS